MTADTLDDPGYGCEIEGCGRWAIYRTSPKGPGQKFRGRCGEHMGAAINPTDRDVAGIIEDRNFGHSAPREPNA